jgi:NAD(P)H-flavin reductase/nitrite reductase/ring-hydroxylating ferredoxin subunit
MMRNDWCDVGATDTFIDGESLPVIAGDQKIAVFRLGDEIFALKDLCTHGNAKLSDGYIEDGCVECPLHQGLFDIRTGEVRCAPLTENVRRFPVRIVDGRVEVDVAMIDDAGEALPEMKQGTVVVRTIARAAHDVAVVHLECSGIGKLDYKAGQYIDVLLENNQSRSYSMATASGSDVIELHIRHMPGGLFSDQVFGSLAFGTALEINGPIGSFYLRDTDSPVILLASGTGFAPVKAIIEEAIRQDKQRSMTLYWGGRQQADLYMHALCLAWAERHAWFHYVPVLSEADSQWTGKTGFVHLAVMADYPVLANHEVYACGAPVVVDAARRDFVGRCALPQHSFYADAFVSKADVLA